jgi:hypothetical protein
MVPTVKLNENVQKVKEEVETAQRVLNEKKARLEKYSKK